MNNYITNRKVELLAPAGNYDCFIAAIANGADAVYVAGNKFGARAYADNFDENQLINIINIAHLHNRKIYLTVNTILKEQEINELYDYIKPYYINGLDGVIVQDIGVVRFLLDNFPEMEVHSSTQMSLTDTLGVQLMKDLGISRVVLARELSLSEISEIYKNTGMEIECFIHGAMCYSYSGKCLLSSFLGGRSGNRGRCAQPCRLQYNNQYPLSMKDMYTLKMIPELIDAGIASFKIEGRMKSPEYVAAVTGIYRKYIDLYYSNEKYIIDPQDESLILDQYTRGGNCNGYYKNYNGPDMITLDSPSYKSNKDYSEYSNDYTTRKLSQLGVTGYCTLIKNNPASLTLVYENISVTYENNLVSEATNRPTDFETINRQLNKTGESLFTFDELYIESDDNIFVPMGVLNDLRRNGFNLLLDEILNSHKRNDSIIEDCGNNYNSSLRSINQTNTINNTFNIADNLCAEALSTEGIMHLCSIKNLNNIIVPIEVLGPTNNCRVLNTSVYDIDTKILRIIKDTKKNIYIKLPYVLRNITDKYIDAVEKIINELNPAGIIVASYEAIQLIRSLNTDCNIISDIHIYSANSYAKNTLNDIGIESTTMPIELNTKELISRNVENELIYAYGRMPLMISSQCVRKTLDRCQNRKGFFQLTDRKCITFPVYCQCDSCINIIYNSTPNFIERDNILISNKNPILVNLLFTTEDDKQIEDIIDYYLYGGEKPVNNYTKGHLNRGVE